MSAYLRATKTVRAFVVCSPKILLKNSDATVVPLFSISSFVDALQTKISRPAREIQAVESTYAKYATLAKMYISAHAPSPSGPAILRVRMGFLTLLRT